MLVSFLTSIMLASRLLLAPDDGNGGAGGGGSDPGNQPTTSAPEDPGANEPAGGGDNQPEGGGADDPGSTTPDTSNLTTEALLDRMQTMQQQYEQTQRELEQYKKAEQEAEEAQLTELQKAQKAADEAEAKFKDAQAALRKRDINDAVRAAAEKAGLKKPHLFLKLIDRSGIDLNAEGQVTGADDAVAKLKEAEPGLFDDAPPTKTANPSTGGGKGSDRSEAAEQVSDDRQVGRAIAKASQQDKKDVRI